MNDNAPQLSSEELLKLITQIVEYIPHMVFVKDAVDLRFVLFNRAGEHLLGYSREDLLGKNDYDLFPAEQADFFTEKDRQVLAAAEVLDIPEEPIETPQGRRWLHTKKVPLFSDSGLPAFLLGISEDISARRRIEHMKDDLLSIASHELRSPTAAIVGTLQLLEARLGDKLDSSSREILTLAQENGARMIELLESCLDVERFEHEDVRLNLRPTSVSEVLRSAARLNQPFADGFDVRYVVDVPEPDLVVRADQERLLQVLTNTMSNAAKFSPGGADVHVGAAAVPAGVRISVRDEGPGIPDAFQERVFQKFARARTSELARNEGAGLGMAIAAQLMERMGGQIGFDTEVGAGTTFWVELPTP